MSNAESRSNPPLELQGFFSDLATLMVAFERLREAGFSRADLSPPAEHPHFGEPASVEQDERLASETDRAQLRTLGTGMASYAGAAAVAGATIATGGAAAVAVAAAAAVGIGSAAAANSAGLAAAKITDERLDQLGAEGRLVLGVRTVDQTTADRASAILREAGAMDVKSITTVRDAMTAGLSAASWTG